MRKDFAVLLISCPKCVSYDSAVMANVTLHEFIDANRYELIGRCRAKVAKRSAPPPTEAEIDHGVPLFLDQLVVELRDGPSTTAEIEQGAVRHGHDLLLQKFTLDRSCTTMATSASRSLTWPWRLTRRSGTDDFRTLNRCLDDAIAGAVTEYSRGQDATRDGESQELRNLATTAITTFDVLQTGNGGVGGSTGNVLRRSLMAIHAFVDRPAAAVE